MCHSHASTVSSSNLRKNLPCLELCTIFYTFCMLVTWISPSYWKSKIQTSQLIYSTLRWTVTTGHFYFIRQHINSGNKAVEQHTYSHTTCFIQCKLLFRAIHLSMPLQAITTPVQSFFKDPIQLALEYASNVCSTLHLRHNAKERKEGSVEFAANCYLLTVSSCLTADCWHKPRSLQILLASVGHVNLSCRHDALQSRSNIISSSASYAAVELCYVVVDCPFSPESLCWLFRRSQSN